MPVGASKTYNILLRKSKSWERYVGNHHAIVHSNDNEIIERSNESVSGQSPVILLQVESWTLFFNGDQILKMKEASHYNSLCNHSGHKILRYYGEKFYVTFWLRGLTNEETSNDFTSWQNWFMSNLLRIIKLLWNLSGIDRFSHRRCSVKKGALRNFANIIEKHPCWSLFLNIALKRDSNTGVYLRNLRDF